MTREPKASEMDELAARERYPETGELKDRPTRHAFWRGQRNGFADGRASLREEMAVWLDRLEAHAQEHCEPQARRLSPATLAQAVRGNLMGCAPLAGETLSVPGKGAEPSPRRGAGHDAATVADSPNPGALSYPRKCPKCGHASDSMGHWYSIEPGNGHPALTCWECDEPHPTFRVGLLPDVSEGERLRCEALALVDLCERVRCADESALRVQCGRVLAALSDTEGGKCL